MTEHDGCYYFEPPPLLECVITSRFLWGDPQQQSGRLLPWSPSRSPPAEKPPPQHPLHPHNHPVPHTDTEAIKLSIKKKSIYGSFIYRASYICTLAEGEATEVSVLHSNIHGFTLIRFFMLDAHSRLSKLVSSAYSSKTSCSRLEIRLTQDIFSVRCSQIRKQAPMLSHRHNKPDLPAVDSTI